MKVRRFGKLRITTSIPRIEWFIDWREFDDPKHFRLIFGRRPVWRPFGKKGIPKHEWNIGKYSILHYGPVER